MLHRGYRLRCAARIRTLGLAAALATLVVSTVGVSHASASSRTLKLYFTHTRESISIVYKRNGSYVGSALRDLNRFLRDWRRNESTKMDPELFDLLWELQQEFGGGTINIVSAYRSPATNSMLRSRSRGVAKNSQHMLGHAIDFYIKGANLAKLRAAGMKRQVGGVGYYPRSGSPFVHMDTGSVRAWPRMSRSELARVFPDGKTLHLPADGKPLSGYAEAQRLEKEGKLTNLRGGGGGGGGGLFASIMSGFSSDKEEAEDDVESERVAPQRSRPAATQVAAARAPSPEVSTARVRPTSRPTPPPSSETASNDSNGGGLFRQLPSVSLGGLIGRSRNDDSRETEAPAVQPVAVPNTPLTSVTTEATPPPTPPVAPPTAPAATEPAEDAPIIVAALPPQRPVRPAAVAAPAAAAPSPATAAVTAPATEASPAADAATLMGYARDEDPLAAAASPQTAVAAIIPRPSEVTGAATEEPRRPILTAVPPGPMPVGITSAEVDALMMPVTEASAELIGNVGTVSGGDFATLVAPDRRTAASDGVLMAPGFLGVATTVAEGGADWLDTDRFTGTRVTVFASPRS